MTSRKSGEPSVAWSRVGMRVIWFAHLLASCFVHGQLYISTTSRGYTSTEMGNPSFECYRSSPSLNAAVSRGRYVYVYNDVLPPVNAANADPPPSEFFNAGNPPIQVYRINLETTDHSSYGAFYCAASLGGERSVVPTLFLRSDAKFVPTSGRFSKTVNKGDVDVTVDFIEVTPSETEKNWRFNGTTNMTVTISAGTIFTELTVYTIIGEVDTSNGGVYELHLMGERGQARAGLLRLIVRACPAGRYDESSGCTQICPSCYNGGICHDQTGICICPPGFQGDGCEMACGGNRYGRNCEYRCDYEIADERTACSGLQVCVPDPYGCSCTPGYKGLDCTTVCDQGKFGASCTETCHCVSEECDRFTGVCTGSSTECEPGWTGTNCQECMVGRYGPNCEPFTISYEKTNKGNRANFVCSLEGGNLISTAPVVNLYRKFGSGNYTQENIVHNGKGLPPNEKFLFLVRDVKVGELFVCALSDVNNFFSDTMTTDGEFIQPELPSAPVVSGATNDSITLMWDAWDASTDIGDPPLMQYRVYYMNNSQEEEVRRSDRLAPSETVTGLSPDTDYVFGVAAVRPGAGGQGRILEVVGTTQCSPPSEGPSSVNVTNGTTPGEFLVSWENPPSNSSSCGSGEGGIRIYFTRSDIPSGISKRAADPNENSVDIPFDPPMSEHTLTLEPYSQYLIQVVVYNKDSETPRGEGFTQTTEEMLAPAPTVSVEATSETVIVRWDAASPAHLNGDVQGYQLRYTQTKPERLDPVVVDVMGNKYEITDGVTKDSEFEIEVRVLNGAGYGEWSPLKTSLPDTGTAASNVPLIAGIVIGIIVVILLIIIIVMALRASKRKREKKIAGMNSTELVDNVLYESNLPLDHQNSNNAARINDKPIVRDPAETEYAYISHESNSLLNDDLNLDMAIKKDTTYEVALETPIASNGKSQTLPLLSGDITLDALNALYAKPEKRSHVVSVPSLLAPTVKEAGTDTTEGDIYENVSLPGSIAVVNLVEHVEKKKAQDQDGFAHEFGLLPSDDGIAKTVAMKPENKAKNRFKNIVAFDHSRVVLETLKDDPHSDYYNANYIRDDKGKKTFIAAQAPNTASINDFWRLIWQENVCSVVMVTNTMEGGKDRCTVYWPKEMGKSKTFGGIEVKLRTIEEFSDHVHRVLDVKQVSGGETRSVHQFHYQSWPDMGVPQYPTTLISYTQTVKHVHERITANTKGSTPMLVHCSAGVGRTGTFISLYCMLAQVIEESRVDIFGFIQKMRKDRPNMVQTADQYILIHTALVEAYMSGNTDVPVSSFEAKLSSLQERNPLTQKLNIEQEFEILNQLTPPVGPQAFKAAGLPANIDKNRFPNVLPMEKNRPCLVTKGEAGSTDYINASFLNTFIKKDVFLATQMPLPHTTGDIWRMVCDWRSPVIVMLNELDLQDKLQFDIP
ncbi:receptor-type tyrosine-protein phosphatase kappa-like [Strongylocentrotus purpuratus]|uniref:protein-tyrosine-phosphatase n=1 Tax=Strongylocentrotus purpuratus TaxID=7668 RepID=A0A7M7PJ46_STRPU|nr:receptor-type tyrosine-protein phosphatase kappa-like [Strongylocentrotus purpuratus]